MLQYYKDSATLANVRRYGECFKEDEQGTEYVYGEYIKFLQGLDGLTQDLLAIELKNYIKGVDKKQYLDIVETYLECNSLDLEKVYTGTEEDMEVYAVRKLLDVVIKSMDRGLSFEYGNGDFKYKRDIVKGMDNLPVKTSAEFIKCLKEVVKSSEFIPSILVYKYASMIDSETFKKHVKDFNVGTLTDRKIKEGMIESVGADISADDLYPYIVDTIRVENDTQLSKGLADAFRFRRNSIPETGLHIQPDKGTHEIEDMWVYEKNFNNCRYIIAYYTIDGLCIPLVINITKNIVSGLFGIGGDECVLLLMALCGVDNDTCETLDLFLRGEGDTRICFGMIDTDDRKTILCRDKEEGIGFQICGEGKGESKGEIKQSEVCIQKRHLGAGRKASKKVEDLAKELCMELFDGETLFIPKKIKNEEGVE